MTVVDYAPGGEFQLVNEGTQQLEELIGRAPDPVADRQALEQIRSAAGPEFRDLVNGFHTHPDRRHARLGALLPGIALLGSPRLADLLGVRAVNALAEAEIITWHALAASAPSSLLHWIVSQRGFRIIDGELVRQAEG